MTNLFYLSKVIVIDRSPEEWRQEFARWRHMLESAKGEKFLDKAKALFNAKDIRDLDTERFEKLVNSGIGHIRFLADADDHRYNTDKTLQ